MRPQGDLCRQSDLEPGAYLKDPQAKKLYEVKTSDQKSTYLIDVSSPVDEPDITGMYTANALKRLQLVRPAPNVEDIASVDEWGKVG